MKRPDDPDVVFLYELKEHRNVDETVVKIMNMNDIRIEFFHLAQEVPCRDYREPSVVARVLAELFVKIMRDLISDIDGIRISGFASARVKTADGFVAFCSGKICNAEHDVTRASEIYCVDLQNPHFRAFLNSIS